jgi:RNA polymerase sigma factor (sigma-70 family)
LEQATITYHNELVQQCQQGSTTGFKALYEKYVKAMYNTSLRIVAHPTDAEDIVQEAFIEAFRNIERFTYGSTFGAWLKRIVINKSINHLRDKKKAFVDIGSVVHQSLADDDVEEEEFELQVESVIKAVKTLPDGYRTVFTLRAFEEYEYEDIAATLGVSEATVRSQYHRARKLLITILKGGV